MMPDSDRAQDVAPGLAAAKLALIIGIIPKVSDINLLSI